VGTLVPAFFDRFVPESGDASLRASGPASSLPTTEPRAGFYKPTRHNESDVEKLVTLLGPLRLRVDDDGTIRFKGKEWSPQGEGIYAATDGSDHLVFLASPEGQTYAATDGPTYQLMPASESLTVNLAVLALIAVVALSALAVPLARLRRRRPRPATTWRVARGLTAGALGLGLGFLVLLLVQLLGDTGDFLYGAPAHFAMLLALPIVVMLMAAAGMVLTVRGWRAAAVTLTARLHQVMLLIGLSTFVGFCWQWNLIGWQYG
jgi:hypothetical protein